MSAQLDDWYDADEERYVTTGRGINATQAGMIAGVPASTIRTWLQRGVIPLARNRRGLIDGLEFWSWWVNGYGALRNDQKSETLAAHSATHE
jgi:hypothetical protein